MLLLLFDVVLYAYFQRIPANRLFKALFIEMRISHVARHFGLRYRNVHRPLISLHIHEGTCSSVWVLMGTGLACVTARLQRNRLWRGLEDKASKENGDKCIEKFSHITELNRGSFFMYGNASSLGQPGFCFFYCGETRCSGSLYTLYTVICYKHAQTIQSHNLWLTY